MAMQTTLDPGVTHDNKSIFILKHRWPLFFEGNNVVLAIFALRVDRGLSLADIRSF